MHSCVHTRAHLLTHKHAFMCAHTRTLINTQTQTCIHVHMHAHTHTHICIHTHLLTNKQTQIRIHILVRTHARTHAQAYDPAYVLTWRYFDDLKMPDDSLPLYLRTCNFSTCEIERKAMKATHTTFVWRTTTAMEAEKNFTNYNYYYMQNTMKQWTPLTVKLTL
jgi:hypothetical protein